MSENFTIAMLILSFLILMGTIAGVAVLSKKRRKTALENSSKNIAIKPFQLFVLGFYAAAFFILLPHWVGKNIEMGIEDVVARIYSSIWLTFHMVFRLSALNEEFANTIAQVISNPTVNSIYYCYSATIFVAAPLMAMSVILSFIKGVRSLFRYYVVNAGKNIVVFSELNEQSLVLAKDILRHDKDDDKKGRRSVVVFTGVTKKVDSALIEGAENLGAVCFRKDITLIRLKTHNKKLTRKLYFISENEEKNLNKGLTVLKTCVETTAFNQETTKIFIFSTATETSILLDNADMGNVFVRRVDVSRNLAYSFLWENDIFKGAWQNEATGKKEINVAIVGFGAYGREMLKAFCWMGQMPGYEVNAVVFDKDKNTESKMKACAPLFVDTFTSDEGELGAPKYSVEFVTGYDVKTYDFLEEVKKKNDEKPFTHVFVSLGDDHLNVGTSILLRSFLCLEEIKKGNAQEGKEYDVKVEGHCGKIYAVVFDDEQYEVVSQRKLKGIKEKKRLHSKTGEDVIKQQNDYEINYIGNLSTVYSVDNIEQTIFEELAWDRHFRYNKYDPEKEHEARESFNQREYNRLSSGASRMFESYRDGTDGKDPAFSGWSDDEKEKIEQQARIEHRRWWVYVATEGYAFVNEELRDDVAKVHYDMIEYDKLDPNEQGKDSVPARPLNIGGKEIPRSGCRWFRRFSLWFHRSDVKKDAPAAKKKPE